MRPEEFKLLLEKYVNGECTPQEERLVDEWYENIETSEKDAVPHLSEMSDEYKQVVEDRIWAKVNPHPPDASLSTGATKSSKWNFPLKMAAVLAVFITSAVLIVRYGTHKHSSQETVQASPEIISGGNEQEHIVNNDSKPFSVQLADGSTVVLQPRSEIFYDKAFDNQLREVRLSGEAFFNVRRDESRPFRVYSEEVVTQVLGTSFTVKAYQGDKEVTVAVRSGKVSVKKKDDSPIILAPNQQARYNRTKNMVVREVVQDPKIILPQSDLFKMSFDEEPVATIFDVLEKNYGIQIMYDEDKLSKCTLTTAMSDEGLFERIKVICKAINASYRVEDGVILIYSTGCE